MARFPTVIPNSDLAADLYRKTLRAIDAQGMAIRTFRKLDEQEEEIARLAAEPDYGPVAPNQGPQIAAGEGPGTGTQREEIPYEEVQDPTGRQMARAFSGSQPRSLQDVDFKELFRPTVEAIQQDVGRLAKFDEESITENLDNTMTPDPPTMPINPFLSLPGGPMLSPNPFGLTPGKPVRETEEERRKRERGESGVADIGAAALRTALRQGEANPGLLAETLIGTQRAMQRAALRGRVFGGDDAVGGLGGDAAGVMRAATGDAGGTDASVRPAATRLAREAVDEPPVATVASGAPAPSPATAIGQPAPAVTPPPATAPAPVPPVATPPSRPKRQRVPVWMAPASDALPELPPVPKPTPAPGGAGGGGKPPDLPSGRSPGGMGEPRRPVPPEDPLAPVVRALDRPEKSAAERVREGGNLLLRQAYDRNYPLRELDKAAGLDPHEGSHAAAQVVSGSVSAGEWLVERDVLPVLDRVGRDMRHLEQYWLLRASEDVLAKYPESRLPGGIDGHVGIRRAMDALKAKLGPERFKAIEDAANSLWKVNVELRLKPLRDAGLISKAQFTAMKNEYPHYLPFHRYEYSSDDVAHLLPQTRPTASVGSPGIAKRTAGGSFEALNRPIEHWMADLIHTRVLIARNDAARMLVTALVKAGEATGETLVRILPERQATAEGLTRATRDAGPISFYVNGEKYYAQAPKIYEVVAKNLEAEPATAFFQLMAALASPLRAGATSLSLSFLPRNIGRDLQSMWLREGISIADPVYWRALKAVIARNSDFGEAALAGVLQSGLIESSQKRDVLKRAQQMRGIEVRDAKDAILFVPRLLGQLPKALLRANEIAEQAPHVATYLKRMGQGDSRLKAAVLARDVTVDFSKSGNVVRHVNMMVPFFNARIQGTANTIRAVRDKPMHALVAVGGPMVFASVATYLWNARYESAGSIPPYEWERSWPVVFGEVELPADPKMPGKRERVPLYFKVPKGDFAAVVTAPAEALLRVAWKQDDRSVIEHFLQAGRQMTLGVTPVDPTVTGLAGSIAPPLAETMYEMGTGTDIYRRRDIVPMGEQKRAPELQYGSETSKVAVALGQQFKVSPRMIEHAIRSYTAGAGQQVLWLTDLALGALGYDPRAPGESMRRPLHTAETVARAPGLSGLIGARGGEQERLGYERLKAATLEGRRTINQVPDVVRLNVTIDDVGDTFDGVPLTPAERAAVQRAAAPKMLEELRKATARSGYAMAPDEGKRAALREAIQGARKDAATSFLKELGSAERDRRRRQLVPAATPTR